MWIIFIIFLIGFLLLLLAICSYVFEWDIHSVHIFWGVIFVIIGLVFIVPVHKNLIKNAKKEQCIELLTEENPYKMVIQYELKDSLYVPVDTLFVLK